MKTCLLIPAFVLQFSALLLPHSAVSAKSETESETVKRVVPAAAVFFPVSQVRLLEGPFKNRYDLNARYLLEMIEPDRLLEPYRLHAGIPSKAEFYDSWEKRGGDSSGTILGRYLSALSYLQASTDDPKIRANALRRINHIIKELMVCLEAKGDGGIIPSTKNAPKLGSVPVDFFKTHKVLAGLRDVYRLAGNKNALVLRRAVADWMGGVFDRCTPEEKEKALTRRFAGMNEMFTEIAADTGDPRYLRMAAEYFRSDYEGNFFGPLLRGEDSLGTLHGAAQITNIVGIAREYELTGDPGFRTAASTFWHKVLEQSYVMGGNSDCEHFFPAREFPGHRTPRTCETCNTYNMLKLTRHLFEWKPDAAQMDYTERALINHILASSGKKPGEFNYFLSLASVGTKAFSKPLGAWWCCVGTGMESPPRYAEQIYAKSAAPDSAASPASIPALWINQYIASALDWSETGVRVSMETLFPDSETVRIKITSADKLPRRFALKLRHPAWCAAPEIKINGRPANTASIPSSYIELARDWNHGDLIELRLPMSLRVDPMPHSDGKIVAFLYGPSVLAAVIPDKPAFNSEAKQRFSLHMRARGKTDAPPPLIVAENTAGILARLSPVSGQFATFRSDKLFKIDRPLKPPATTSFIIHETTLPAGSRTAPTVQINVNDYAALVLMPLHRIYEEQYAVYSPVLNEEEWTERVAEIRADWRAIKKLAADTIDTVIPGWKQSEDKHTLREKNSKTNKAYGKQYRVAPKNGDWFSYEMAVSPDTSATLIVTVWGGIWWGTWREFDISIDGRFLARQRLSNNSPGDLLDLPYPIPAELTKGKDKITVRITARTAGPEIFKLRTVRVEK